MWFLVPPHLRVAFICSVSLVWQVFLSTRTFQTSGRGRAADTAAAALDQRGRVYPLVMSARPRSRSVLYSLTPERRRALARIAVREADRARAMA